MMHEISTSPKTYPIYKKWLSSVWAVPLILFGVSFMAFGLLAPKLGFYMDDWPYVYYAYTQGIENIDKMLLYDSRPYAGWLYKLGFTILGFKPLYWHFSTLFFRWLSAFALWISLNSLWKNHKKLATYSALLFAVYPFFLMQPLALGSTHHWVGFALYLFSLWFMIRAESTSKWRIHLIFGSLLLETVHLFTAEYYSGLELLRPFVLWILISRQEMFFFKRLLKTFLRWVPYLIILGGYFYWRLIVFEGPPTGDRNSPVLLYQFLEEPLKASFSLFITVLKDSSIILLGTWAQAIEPAIFNLTSIFTSFALFIMLGSFFLLYILLNHLFLEKGEEIGTEENRNQLKESMLLGVVALVSGTLPIWVIGKSISTHTNQMAATRFGIPAMLGAAILLSAGIIYFIGERKKANLAISILLALAIGVHLHNAHLYEYSWEKQQNFYHQLIERIPALEPNTAILSEAENLLFMGEYPTAYAINTLYFPVNNVLKEEAPYWFFTGYAGYYDKIDTFIEGVPLEKKHLLSSFSGNSHKSLIISYVPERGQCLWVLRPEDANLRLISGLERKASLSSAIDRILIDEENTRFLPPEIFGEEIPENWCSYYQKADLARQRSEWAEITTLWEEAQKANKAPANGFEYIPFIEGYAHQENWGRVKEMTRQSNKITQGMSSILCPTLINIEENTPVSAERENILINLRDYLSCE